MIGKIPVFHEDTDLDDISREYIANQAKGSPRISRRAWGARYGLNYSRRRGSRSHVLCEMGDSAGRLQGNYKYIAPCSSSLTTVLVIEQEQQIYFAPKEPLFGAEFAAKFKTSGVFELDEAAKCLALGRSTAAVFHLMRLLEIGIRATSHCLQIPDPIKPAERNWAIILKRIWEDGIEKVATPTDRMAGDGHLFEALHASLDAVKNPWRDGSMRVESKYTDDEAEHILVATRGFMKRLASRMDESGLPLA